MKLILFLNFLMLTLFNFAHPVTPLMMEQKGSPDFLFGLFFFMMSAGTFIFSPKWGNKIDTIGTRKILAISPLVYAIGQFIFAYFSSPILMLLGRFLSGVFASAWIVGVTAYINLMSKPENKIRNFGYQMVATSLGGVVGQMLSGQIGSFGVYYSFTVQIAGLIAMAVIVPLTVKNLYPKKKVTTKKTGFVRGYNLLKEKGYLKLMISMVMLATIANIAKGMPSYFGSDIANFTTTQVGNLNGYINGLTLVANLFIIQFLEKNFTFKKSYMMQLIACVIGASIIVIAVFNVGVGLAFSITFIGALTLISLGAAMYKPYVQKEIVNSSKFEQGEILGVIQSFNAIGMLLSSGSMTLLYPIAPQLPFIAMLIFAIGGLMIFISYNNDQART